MPRRKPVPHITPTDPLSEWSDLLSQAEAATSRLRRGAGARRQKTLPPPPEPEPLAEATPYDPEADDPVIQSMYAWNQTPEQVEAIASPLRQRILALPDRESFKLFVACVRPLVAGWYPLAEVHETIFDALLSDEENTLCMVSRNTGKSTLAGWWVCWFLLKDPYTTTLHISRSVAFARRNLRACQAVLDRCPICINLRPTDQCLQSSTEVEVPAAVGANLGAPSLAAVGIETAITGRRCTVLLADDVEVMDLHFSTLKSSDLHERFGEALALLSPGGKCRIIGTPHGDAMSFYFRLLKAEDSTFKLYKAAVVREKRYRGCPSDQPHLPMASALDA